MSQNNIGNEILTTEQEIKHLGSCTTKGLTDEEIAQQDERFFLAISKLKWLKNLKRHTFNEPNKTIPPD